MWCGVPNPDAGIPDTIDDASGLYPRWTIFQSDADDRKSFKSPPSIASDIGYVERTIDLQCFWMDANGAPDINGDGVISAQESRLDPNMPLGIDDDGDCLADCGRRATQPPRGLRRHAYRHPLPCPAVQ